MGKSKKNNVTVTIKDELIKELNNFSKEVCVGAAAYVRDTLTDTAYEAFERYYCDYQPVSGGYPCSYSWKFFTPEGHPTDYVRTFNVLTNKVIQKFYENKHGKIIRGGVELVPENMKENYDIPASASSERNNVFANISAGYHGLPAPYNKIPDMNPSPQEIVMKKHNDLCNDLITLENIGVTRAKKGSYTYLSI